MSRKEELFKMLHLVQRSNEALRFTGLATTGWHGWMKAAGALMADHVHYAYLATCGGHKRRGDNIMRAGGEAISAAVSPSEERL